MRFGSKLDEYVISPGGGLHTPPFLLHRWRLLLETHPVSRRRAACGRAIVYSSRWVGEAVFQSVAKRGVPSN